jgi:threonine/homoserine/homoserine lactone efflux protein
MPETLPGFVLAVALLAMVPGPATALVIRQTIRDGRRTALLTTAGNEVGLLAWAPASPSSTADRPSGHVPGSGGVSPTS